MDEDISLQEILRRLAEENPDIYPSSPSWMSPFTKEDLGLFRSPPTLYGTPVPEGEVFKPRQKGIPTIGPQAAVANYEAQHPVPSKDNVKEPDDDDDDDDYLNQLMMAALMKGGEKGKMGQLGGAAGGGISFGVPWTMNAPWEKDYRYLS